MGNTITLAMIVKNEAANIKRCLESVSGQVDEIVIVDTGSTDNTLEIAKNYTNNIYSFSWNGDFSAARNFAVEMSTCNWILSLDADEELVSGTGNLKLLIAQSKQPDAYFLPLDNPVSDSPGEFNRFLVLRLFKNSVLYRFKGEIHEQITVKENGVAGIAEGPVIKHRMLPAKERNRKRGRNLNLLKKVCAKEPQNLFMQYYLAVEWLMLGKCKRALPYLQQVYHNLTDDHLLFRGPALRYLIICLKELGRLDEAICLCLEADFRYPDFTDIYYLGGVLFEEKKEFSLAVNWLSQAVKCGAPPPLYSHMNGTESFLALYHLGYCHEMLGQTKDALNHYQRALDVNPDYIFPIYNLFLIVLAKQGPRRALDYFKEKGYLSRYSLATAIAGLFHERGFPNLAAACLESCNLTGARIEELCFCLGKYNVYSGKFKKGLDYLKKTPEGSDFFIQSQVHSVVALLLLGQVRRARSLSLKMWKNPDSRRHALLLLNLTCMMEKDKTKNYVPKLWQQDLTEIALEMFDHTVRYLSGINQVRKNNHFARLAGCLESIIKSDSVKGFQFLINYFRDKSVVEQSYFDYKYNIDRGGV